jgi:hypothetical protein
VRRHTVVVLVVALCTIIAGQQPATSARRGHVPGTNSGTNAVIEWNATAAAAALASKMAPANDPLHEARLYAMMHIAIHDALNAIDRRSRPYVLNMGVLPKASPDAAVAVAARDVLVPVLRDLPDFLDPNIDAAVKLVEDRYNAALAAIPDGVAKNQGMAIGRAAAAAIVATRADDHSDSVFLDIDYQEGTKPGEFRFVEGAPFAVAPEWGEVTPFVVRDIAEIRPRPPYDVTSKKYAADFNELKRLGGPDDGTSARTADQTQIALYWFESSPLRWNRIARIVSQSAGLDRWEAARLFGLMNMAMSDGYVANWDSKYVYKFWRPETAVRLADSDGNPDTVGDDDWLPLWGSSGATPEYDSGHSIEGAAAAEVMKRVLGTDRMTFSTCSYSMPTGKNCGEASPTTRTYTSFSKAAAENGLSRILVGWHFRNSVEVGLKRGQNIGERAVDRFMRPAHD